MRSPNPEETAPRSLASFAYYLLVLWAALVLGFFQFETAVLRNPAGAYSIHQQLIAGTTASPYRYRVLAPYLAEALSRLTGLEPLWGICAGYLIYQLAASVFSLTVLFAYLRLWFSPMRALLGCLLAFVSMIVALGDGYFQPWSILEMGLFTFGLLLSYQRQHGWLIVVTVIATLNRETGLFVPLAYLATQTIVGKNQNGRQRATLAWTGLYLTSWAVIFFGLRFGLGFTTDSSTLTETLQRNLSGPELALTFLKLALFFGAGWGLLWRGYSASPDFVKRAWRIAPLYLLAIALWGIWQEVRLLTTLYPLLIPTALSALNETEKETR